MDGPDNVALANTNSNASELHLMATPGQDAKQSLGNVDLVQSDQHRHQADQETISPAFSPNSQHDDILSSSHSNHSQEETAAGVAPDGDEASKNETEGKGQEELGRNRRVRQKNRYFLDFHCSNLTKGSRSRDEFDAYAAATGGGGSATRSSNRRATADSVKTPVQGPPETDDTAPLIVTKYCRACYTRTAHDQETGCQACLYRRIIFENKRQKTSNSRPRPSRQQQQQQQQQPSKPAHQQAQSRTPTAPIQQPQQQQQKQQHELAESQPSLEQVQPKQEQQQPAQQQQLRENADNDHVDAIGASNKNPCIPKLTATMKVDGSGQKRKWVVKPSRSPNDENVISIRRETEHCTKMESLDEKPASTLVTTNENRAENNNNNNNHVDHANKKVATSCDTKASNQNNHTSSNNSQPVVDGNNDLELTNLDKWTPEQVACYVSSKGFTHEADSFKSQAVDGFSLLLMQRTDFTHGLKMKLGPALKLYNQVCKLKDEYFRQIAHVS